MHRRHPLDEFMRLIGQQFVIDQRSERTLKLPRETLPGTPTVIILMEFRPNPADQCRRCEQRSTV
jgi:hypothetical protein